MIIGHNLSVLARITESQRQTKPRHRRTGLSEDAWIAGNNIPTSLQDDVGECSSFETLAWQALPQATADPLYVRVTFREQKSRSRVAVNSN
jgi:hypothetical protein